MIRLFRHRNAPSVIWSAAVLFCGLVSGRVLWQHNMLPEAQANALHPSVAASLYEGMGEEVPSFVVMADVVRVMRVIPLAGRALRSPCAHMPGDILVLDTPAVAQGEILHF